MTELVKIYPNPLIIHRESPTSYFPSKIHIKNISKDYLVFNIYMTKLLLPLYKINPCCSYIAPNSELEINIKRYNKEGNKESKIILVFYPVNKAITSKEMAKEMIKNHCINDSLKQEVSLIICIDDVIREDDNDDLDNYEKKLEIETNLEEKINLFQKVNEIIANKRDAKEREIDQLKIQWKNIQNNKLIKEEKDNSIYILYNYCRLIQKI